MSGMKYVCRVVEGGGFCRLLKPDEQYREIQFVDVMIDIYMAKRRGDITDIVVCAKCERYCREIYGDSSCMYAYESFCNGRLLRDIPEDEDDLGCLELHPELEMIDFIIMAYMIYKKHGWLELVDRMGSAAVSCEECCRRLCSGASLVDIYQAALDGSLLEKSAKPATKEHGDTPRCNAVTSVMTCISDIQRHLAFSSITAGMLDTYKRKNHDYGDSFAKLRAEMPTAILVRLFDKYSRLKALLQKPDDAQVKDESIDDTLLDLATYAVMELVERRLDKKKGD